MKAVGMVISLLLTACASAPPMPPAGDLFHDELFAPPSEPIDPADAMAVSPEMRQYLATKIPNVARHSDRKRLLIDALYNKDELRLEYDAAQTRTAAQAFNARQGNCLALVMMTSALAKELGLAVRYREVLGTDELERFGDIYLSVGHVNLSLDDRPSHNGIVGIALEDSLTVDFVPSRNAQVSRTRPIREQTVIAMYLNNRAVEVLTRGDVTGAYWWVRQSIQEDPEYTSAYLTLGVVYRKHRRPDLADPVLARVTEREPGNIRAITNRMLVLQDLGRVNDAVSLQKQLERMDPHPPYSYFREAMTAMRERRFELARDLLARESARAPHNHEFQFWLAVANLELHDTDRARAHLKLAIEYSTTRKDRDLYAGKLAKLDGR